MMSDNTTQCQCTFRAVHTAERLFCEARSKQNLRPAADVISTQNSVKSPAWQKCLDCFCVFYLVLAWRLFCAALAYVSYINLDRFAYIRRFFKKEVRLPQKECYAGLIFVDPRVKITINEESHIFILLSFLTFVRLVRLPNTYLGCQEMFLS